MQWNIKNVMSTIRYLQINKISALDNPEGVDRPLNRSN